MSKRAGFNVTGMEAGREPGSVSHAPPPPYGQDWVGASVAHRFLTRLILPLSLAASGAAGGAGCCAVVSSGGQLG